MSPLHAVFEQPQIQPLRWRIVRVPNCGSGGSGAWLGCARGVARDMLRGLGHAFTPEPAAFAVGRACAACSAAGHPFAQMLAPAIPQQLTLCPAPRPIPHPPTAEAPTPSRVYVHNLPWSLTNEELAQHMSQAGTVRYASIMTTADGRSKVRRREGLSAAHAGVQGTRCSPIPCCATAAREPGVNLRCAAPPVLAAAQWCMREISPARAAHTPPCPLSCAPLILSPHNAGLRVSIPASCNRIRIRLCGRRLGAHWRDTASRG